jgi:hypothetical protein
MPRQASIAVIASGKPFNPSKLPWTLLVAMPLRQLVKKWQAEKPELLVKCVHKQPGRDT